LRLSITPECLRAVFEERADVCSARGAKLGEDCESFRPAGAGYLYASDVPESAAEKFQGTTFSPAVSNLSSDRQGQLFAVHRLLEVA
jgi:hypothetical protein